MRRALEISKASFSKASFGDHHPTVAIRFEQSGARC